MFVIRVFGKVQGVWFRKSTKEVADRLGIHGIVMNEPDGSVYIQAQGNDQAMEEFILFCKTGPEEAEVTNVVITENNDVSGQTNPGFEVLR